MLDTGPVVASLDRHDSHHAWVIERFSPVAGRLVTTGAVITEAAFLLQDVSGGIRHLVEFLAALRVEVWDCFTQARMNSAAKLMETYAGVPMDFADASLILAAEHFESGEIATLDQRGFRTFRYGRNKRFRLLLQGD